MKKQTDLTTINASKKKFTMPAGHLSNNKNKHYIYTEEDLGEGILNEGVSLLYSTSEKENMSQAGKVLNVEEDFSYAYYCW